MLLAARRALHGAERLWKIFWLGAIPVALGATALTFGADALRDEGHHATGAFVDVLKLLLYAAWFVAVWRCARNASNLLGAAAGRLAVAGGVLAAALTV